jgi:hypothetical protein
MPSFSHRPKGLLACWRGSLPLVAVEPPWIDSNDESTTMPETLTNWIAIRLPRNLERVRYLGLHVPLRVCHWFGEKVDMNMSKNATSGKISPQRCFGLFPANRAKEGRTDASGEGIGHTTHGVHQMRPIRPLPWLSGQRRCIEMCC